MCHLSVGIDQSRGGVAPLCEAIAGSAFYIRSIRLVPVAWSSNADVYLSLGGGSKDDLKALLTSLTLLPAVLSAQHIMPPV